MECFDYNDIFDLIIFSKLTLCQNFYIFVKHLNFNFDYLKNNSKSKSLYSLENNSYSDEIDNSHYNPLGDISIFNNNIVCSIDQNENLETDKFFIIKLICEKFLLMITHYRQTERRLDSHSYCLMLIIYNM